MEKEDWKSFFELNPTIRRFKCNHKFLLENEDWLLVTHIQFDSLTIENGFFNRELPPCSLLNQLYARGFYKKMHLFIWEPNQNFMDEIGKLRGVDILDLRFLDKEFNFPVMDDVKEMFLYAIKVDFEVLMKKFQNVERIELWNAAFNQMMILIRWSVKLKDLKVAFWHAEKIQQLNLSILNKEREKLSGARKVTIYVRDDIFLATKWANDGRDFKLIEMKRFDAGVFHSTG